jgi:peptide/nickel transport system substrate-binding protein
MAIDREEILRVLNMPDELKIFDTVFTDRQYRQNEIPAPLPYAPEEAAQLLDEVGWTVGRKGVRSRDGQEFRFELLVPPGNVAMGAYEGAAVLIQAQLRDVGVQMDIQSLDEGLFMQRMRSGRFQAAINRFFQGANYLLLWLGEESPLGYDNPLLTPLLKENVVTVELEEVNRIFSEIMPLMALDMPLTFLFPQIDTSVAHIRIKGLSSPYRASPLWVMEHLWIEDR